MKIILVCQREDMKNRSIVWWRRVNKKLGTDNWLEIQEGKRRRALSAIEYSQNRRNRRDRPGLISQRDRSARGSRGSDRACRPHTPSGSLPAYFFGTVARSSNFTIRFPPGDELLKRDARRSFPVSYCIPISRARSKLDRIAQDAIGRG